MHSHNGPALMLDGSLSAKGQGVSGRAKTVFFLGDPQESLDQEWDSSLRLMAAHGRMGNAAHWASYQDIVIAGRHLILGGREVTDDDVVWLRFDPSQSIRFYETLRALCHVAARIINPPEMVLTVHDKRSALDLCPRPTWSVFSQDQLPPIAAAIGRLGGDLVVLKPPSLFGSKGVQFVGVNDLDGLMAGFADLVGLFGYVIAEPYLGPGGGVPPVDTRVLLTPRRVMGVIDRIIPLGGGLQDVCQGAPLSPVRADLVRKAQTYMQARGIMLAGLDFLGDTLTEINVSCPGAIPEVNMFCHVRAEDMIVEDVLTLL